MSDPKKTRFTVTIPWPDGVTEGEIQARVAYVIRLLQTEAFFAGLEGVELIDVKIEEVE